MFTERFKNHAEYQLQRYPAFTVDIDPDLVWATYLNAFPLGTNPIHYTKTEHDCSCCRRFIQAMAGVVIVVDGRVQSIFRHQNTAPYTQVFGAVADLVEKLPISDIFLKSPADLGVVQNYGLKPDGHVVQYNHLHLTLPARCIGDNAKLADLRGDHDVFARCMREVSLESLDTVLQVIGTAYRGNDFKHMVVAMRQAKAEYLASTDQNTYCWQKALSLGSAVARTWNSAIGTLIKAINNGTSTANAIREYELVVDPTRYRRVDVRPVSDSQISSAEKQLAQDGLLPALSRRFANMGDLSIQNVLWANPDIAPALTDNARSVLQSMRRGKTPPANEMPMKEFVANVLPTAHSIEVLFNDSRQLFSLIAPAQGAPPLFKWGNGMSWVYNGNVVDAIRQAVKTAGGSIDGELRFSIRWPKGNNNDYDAHCVMPQGEISFRNQTVNGGVLDVDQIPGVRHKGDPNCYVENIVFKKIDGHQYKFNVHNFHRHAGQHGFDAQIELLGKMYHYRVQDLANKATVEVATVRDKQITHHLPVIEAPKDAAWGLEVGKFYPVSIVTRSPNYWGGIGIGTEHIFFCVPDCLNPNTPNGFFQEFLDHRYDKHKSVLAALADRMCVPPSDQQLSGIGFTNSITVRVNGSRVINIKE